MPRALLLALLLGALHSCRPTELAIPMNLGAPLRAESEPIHARSAAAEDDSLGLTTPQDIAALPSGFAVVDHGNDRIVMLSPELRPIRTIARSGSGPGELQLPMYVEPHADGIAVGDLTNRRITTFDSLGRYRSSHRLAVAVRHFTHSAGGHTFMAARMRGHYLLRVAPNEESTPLAPRALEFYPRRERRLTTLPFGAGSELVARTTDGGIHVFDNRVGVLLRFDSAGHRTMARALPPDIAAQLAANRDRRVRALRRANHDVVTAPLAKDLTLTDSGQLLLLFSTPRLFGLLIDPSTYDARALELPVPDETHPLWRATAGVLVGDRMTVISRADVLTYTLLPATVAAR